MNGTNCKHAYKEAKSINHRHFTKQELTEVVIRVFSASSPNSLCSEFMYKIANNILAHLLTIFYHLLNVSVPLKILLLDPISTHLTGYKIVVTKLVI